MNLILFYISFAIGSLAGSSFLYSLVIFSQTLSAMKGFSGLVFFFLFLPFPIIFLYTGYLLDRYSKKWILLSFQSIHTVVSFLIVLFLEDLILHPNYLLILAFLNGIGLTTVLPGRMSILRDIAHTHRVVFHTILGNLLTIFCFGMSPLLVGAIKESGSFKNLFFTLGCMHLVSVSSALFLKVDVVKSEIKKWNYSEVLHFLREDRVSRQVLYVSILSMLALGPIQVLLPKYVKETLALGELARGTVLVAFGPGLFIGGVLTIIFHHLENKGKFLLGFLFLSSILFLGIVPFFLASVTSIFLFLFGVSGGVISSLMPALLQKRSDDQIRGRLLSLYTVCFQFTPAVSGLGSAFLGDLIGIPNAFLSLGIFFAFLSFFSYFLYSELRES
ncbi:MFS transporter [Leptospira ognonensis]|uniref:MFS transporter n=2 Tax=Leptospira ognonensis TaxID=2484945 RepID=A0A4R9KCS2_9LEPT|nr:MFS transporter [Leptospira ognonensis]TGL63851.1 MFS transporter [Leptospira ognonensis]